MLADRIYDLILQWGIESHMGKKPQVNQVLDGGFISVDASQLGGIALVDEEAKC
jgi:hypothetical protein